MRETMQGPVLVAKAEVEEMKGMRELAVAVGRQWKEQRAAQDQADARGLEIGRLICEFAARAEVVVQLGVLNAKENRPNGGSPKKAHCWVAEQIANPELGLSTRHLERCARAFLKAQAKGLPINTSIRVAEASAVAEKYSDKPLCEMQPSPERLFNTEATGNDDDDAFDPDRDAVIIARKIKAFFYTPEGHSRLKTKKQKDSFAQKLQEQFELLKIDWVIEPKD